MSSRSSSTARPRARGGAPTVERRAILRDWSLSLVLGLLFFCSFIGVVIAGWHAMNTEQRHHGEQLIPLSRYLRSGSFGEAIFENWESEFLEMTAYVVLTIFLFQRGSSESKSPDHEATVDDDPRRHRDRESAPWPVKRGGWVLRLYENSLALAFAFLFILSFFLHARVGVAKYNEELTAHGAPTFTYLEYLGSSRFWFESFQNWQSEFLALTSMVVLSIFLRQRGSPESKPVATPTWETVD